MPFPGSFKKVVIYCSLSRRELAKEQNNTIWDRFLLLEGPSRGGSGQFLYLNINSILANGNNQRIKFRSPKHTTTRLTRESAFNWIPRITILDIVDTTMAAHVQVIQIAKITCNPRRIILTNKITNKQRLKLIAASGTIVKYC